MGDVFDINTSCGYIGGSQQVDGVGFEKPHDLIALVLSKVTMNGINTIAQFPQIGAQVLSIHFGAAEDDAAHVWIEVDEPAQGLLLVAGPYVYKLVLDVLVDLIFLAYTYLFRVFHVVLDNPADIVGHGGREEPGNLFFRGKAQNFIQFILKAHIEHLIGFIEHQTTDLRKVECIPFDQID